MWVKRRLSSNGIMTATLKACGTKPVAKKRLIWFSLEASTKGKTSLSSLVEAGSCRHVADLVIAEVTFGRLLGEKLPKYAPSLGGGSKETVFCGLLLPIFVLIFTIVAVKKVRKSLLLKVGGMHGSTALCFLISLTTVLEEMWLFFFFLLRMNNTCFWHSEVLLIYINKLSFQV